MRDCAAPAERHRLLATCKPEQIEKLTHVWHVWARDSQLAPLTTAAGKPWRTWLFLGGRGAGKTRAGAEWVRAEAFGTRVPAGSPQGCRNAQAKRIALIGPSLQHVRSVMIEGVSGLLAIHPEKDRPTYEASKNQLVWPNGSIGQMFAADEYETLRGPQFHAAWCDELCRWKKPQAAWDMLQLSLRLGDDPRAVITTTPKYSKLIKAIASDESTAVVIAHPTGAPFRR